MATSDRMYELTCECRDTEERMERVMRENRELREAARDLLEESPPSPAGERMQQLLG